MFRYGNRVEFHRPQTPRHHNTTAEDMSLPTTPTLGISFESAVFRMISLPVVTWRQILCLGQ